MKKLITFLRYDNAVPIVLGLLFLGAGSAFAATNPEAILNTTELVLSVDNTYLVNKDLSAWTPRVTIVAVTEDAESYFVSYTFSTIGLQDSVWQDTVREEVMQVSKEDLGPYRDLGVYVTEQLKQKVAREKALLVETQAMEQKQVSQKTVAVTYGGLIGVLIDDSTETLPGYIPVVTPLPDSRSDSVVEGGSPVVRRGTSAPSIQIFGNNPARIPVGTRYADLGALVSDDKDVNMWLSLSLDGYRVEAISIDTSTTSVWTVGYSATDSDGNTTVVERIVEVYDPRMSVDEVSVSTTTVMVAPSTW